MRTQRTGLASLCVVLLLSACGGGGGGGGDSSSGNGSDQIASSASVQDLCFTPRPATALDQYGRPYGDRAGTRRNELDWVRAWIDETYLWYHDVRGLSASTLDAANYGDPVSYFNALKSPVTTASGKLRDAYHFTYDTADWVRLSTAGQEAGYGMTVVFSGWTRPRSAVVAFTQAGTAAALAGINRGQQVVMVDGVDLVNGTDEWTIYRGLFPSAAGSHTLALRDPTTGTTRSVTLTASVVSLVPVHNVMTLPAPNQRVGYLQFDDHLATAEPLLVNAFSQLAAAGVTDLVLDIRYNGGGYLDIASEVAYMVAGPTRTAGQVFERAQVNDRNPFNWTNARHDTPFHTRTQGFSGSAGVALPTLNLSRVYVLSTDDTCSASEAIINGLRGVGVQVLQIGGTTCGKPYGFYPTDNCGTTYFAVQFQGVNALGFGDYADGLAPTCRASDDFTHALGDPAEGLLSTALALRAQGVCPPTVPGGATASSVRSTPPMGVMRSPLRNNRWLQSRASRAG